MSGILKRCRGDENAQRPTTLAHSLSTSVLWPGERAQVSSGETNASRPKVRRTANGIGIATSHLRIPVSDQDHSVGPADAFPVVKKAAKENRYTPRIQADEEGGIRSGVNGTPTFFLNGAIVEAGTSGLAEAIRSALTHAKSEA